MDWRPMTVRFRGTATTLSFSCVPYDRSLRSPDHDHTGSMAIDTETPDQDDETPFE